MHAHYTAKQRIHPCTLFYQQRQHIHIEPTKNPEQMIDNTKSEYNSGSGAETVEATLLRSAAVVSGLLFIHRNGMCERAEPAVGRWERRRTHGMPLSSEKDGQVSLADPCNKVRSTPLN